MAVPARICSLNEIDVPNPTGDLQQDISTALGMPIDLPSSPNNILIIDIQDCGVQRVSLPTGTVTVSALMTAVNSQLVGAVLAVSRLREPDGQDHFRLCFTSDTFGSGSHITIESTVASGALGFPVPNNEATGSDQDGPDILTFYPPCYLVTGGVPAVVTGTNFQETTAVSIGERFNLLNQEFVSSTEIRGVIPAGEVGTYDVFVVNPDGQESYIENGFTYIAIIGPKIISVTPNQGYKIGGTPVTITGSGFSFGMRFNFGTKAATDVVVISTTEATCKTPPSQILGVVDVQAISLDNQFSALINGFTYIQAPKPEITSVNPNTGPLAGGIRILITGSNFLEGVKVIFGINESTDVIFNSPEELDALLPAGVSLGFVDVEVRNPDDAFDRLVNGFQYVAAPQILSIVPNQGPTSGGTPVVISGALFFTGAKVTFGGLDAFNVLVLSASTISCLTPPHIAEVVDVTVTNLDTQSCTLQRGYTYLALSDNVQVSTSDLCEVQGFDREVDAAIRCIETCRNKAEQTIEGINKRLSAYGEPTVLQADLVAGDTQLVLRDEIAATGDTVLVYDNNNSTGELGIVGDVEPMLSGYFTFFLNSALKNTYLVSASAHAKRVNTEFLTLRNVSTVVPDVRTSDQLNDVKLFLSDYINFVNENLDENL